jgi:alkylation response protein AidB-like acyl-CoA dehydrogenase
MTGDALKERLREIVLQTLPLPGLGHTPERHRLLAETARENVALAKLAEAHWDAVSILSEAGRTPEPNALYAVWASEVPGVPLRLTRTDTGFVIDGTKPFCSGIGLVDRALVTASDPEQLLVEVDLRLNESSVDANLEIWKTDAFRSTQTGSLTFTGAKLDRYARIGGPQWYLERPGFWHGACGPAACWAGGAAGLVDFALANKRSDAHTLAHLGAMEANVWAMFSLLSEAGREIDESPNDGGAAQIRALQLRHLIEQMASDILHRFARAYGPQPLSMNEEMARRFHEVDLYMRQSHGERDLEALGAVLRNLR